MDGNRFDALAISVARVLPRRAALRLLAGSALGGLLAGWGPGEAAAKCARSKKRCGKKCIPKTACCTNARKSRWVRAGETVKECGRCSRGKVVADSVECGGDSCSECNGRTFRCQNHPDGERCLECGKCAGGRCLARDDSVCTASPCDKCDGNTMRCYNQCEYQDDGHQCCGDHCCSPQFVCKEGCTGASPTACCFPGSQSCCPEGHVRPRLG